MVTDRLAKWSRGHDPDQPAMLLVSFEVHIAESDHLRHGIRRLKPTGGSSNWTQTSVCHFSGFGMSIRIASSGTGAPISSASPVGQLNFNVSSCTRIVVEISQTAIKFDRTSADFDRSFVQPALAESFGQSLRCERHLGATKKGEQRSIVMVGELVRPDAPAIIASCTARSNMTMHARFVWCQ